MPAEIILAFVHFLRNRHRFFDRDPNIEGDIPTVRRLRVEVILSRGSS